MEWLRTKVAELEDAITHRSTMRKLGSDLRAVFYNTEEELKRSERVKYTGIRDSVGTLGYPRIPQLSQRVWVKYNDGIWAGTVSKVDHARASFDVRFECDDSTDTIRTSSGVERVFIFFEDMGQPQNLAELSEEALREWLQQQGLSTQGKHAVLKMRLQKALSSAPASRTPGQMRRTSNSGNGRQRSTQAQPRGAAAGALGNPCSRFFGVCWKKQSRKWQVQFCEGKVRRYLGTFPLEEEQAAAWAYDVAAHAAGRTQLNFPNRARKELGPIGARADNVNSEGTQAFEPVEWEHITPFRGYAKDSDEFRGRARQLVQQNSGKRRRDQLIFAEPKWEQVVGREQIMSMAQHPDRLR